MPTVEPADGSRFVRITDPESEPLFFDASAVAAVEGRPEGRFSLHLVGGQNNQLKPAIAAAVLKQLGLPAPRSRPKPKTPREPKVKQAAKRAPGWFAKAWDVLVS
jgi:hypothetical protein